MTYQFRNAIKDRLGDFEAEVYRDDISAWVNLTVSPNARHTHFDVPAFWQQIEDSGDFEVMPPKTAEEIAANYEGHNRTEREYIFRIFVDPIVMNPLRWEGLSQNDKDALTTYRQELLDITAQEGWPTSVAWPTVPTILQAQYEAEYGEDGDPS
jgi:hypothetical protein